MKGWKFAILCLQALYDGCSAGVIVYSVYNLYNTTHNSSTGSLLSLITQWFVFVAQALRYLVILANVARAERACPTEGAP